jgi:uncharacterized protein with von Willebrand factor type A (vWA) domain
MTNKMLEMLGASREAAKTVTNRENNLDMDRFDHTLFSELVDVSPKLNNLIEAGPETYPALLQDLWGAFYKMNPALVDEKDISPAHKFNRPFVERLMEDRTTQETRLTTVLDETASAIATLSAGESLREQIENNPELKQAMEQAQEALQAEQDGDEAGAAKIGQQIQEQMRENARMVRRAIKEAVEDGKEEVGEAIGVLGSWGLETKDLQRVPMDERLKLIERLKNPRLSRASDLIGRMRNLARAKQKSKVKKGRDDIHSITLGNDLEHILPTELGALSHPLRNLDFKRRYTEGQLLQYDLQGKEKVGRGPMVANVDVSGSMTDRMSDGSTRLDWAVSIALALVDTATRQKRKSRITFFNGNIVNTVEFLPGERNVEKMLQVATSGASGGTNFKYPLEDSVRTIEQVGYRQADVVFITDGECEIDESFERKFKEKKAALGFQVWSIIVGGDSGASLERWSDKVWSSREFTEDVAGEVFQEVY